MFGLTFPFLALYWHSSRYYYFNFFLCPPSYPPSIHVQASATLSNFLLCNSKCYLCLDISWQPLCLRGPFNGKVYFSVPSMVSVPIIPMPLTLDKHYLPPSQVRQRIFTMQATNCCIGGNECSRYSSKVPAVSESMNMSVLKC